MVQQLWASKVLDFIRSRNCFVIDLREREQFRKGHLPKAVLVDPQVIENDEFHYEKNIPIVVYCEEGSISLRMSRLLSMRGYYVFNLAGGYEAFDRYQKNGNY